MRNDMKMLLFSLCVIIVIIISGLFIYSFLQKTTDKFTGDIKSVETSIKQDNWKKAYESINKLSEEWKMNEGRWALFINHREIDNITSNLDMATGYIKYKNKEGSFAYLFSLKDFFEHVPDMEKVNLKNIF